MGWLVPEQDVHRLSGHGPATIYGGERSRVAERDFPRWGKSRVPARNKTSQTLNYQHCVAVAIKPVLLSNCFLIRLLDQFLSSERAGKHKQRGPGQVKISEQAIH